MLAQTLKRIIADHCGFLAQSDVATLAEADRLRQLLVRCNACRFLAAAQDVAHLIEIITASRRDSVRDVSLPASDPAYTGHYQPVTPQFNLPDTRPDRVAQVESRSAAHFDPDDCGGVFDGVNTVYSDADPGL